MASEFNRILALLRKERGITQKQAAADLGISQAQLSHYEKGIRECSLAFVVQVADYYGVSCDYLLGRSADRSGQTISVADLPETGASTSGSVYRGSVLPTMYKKLIENSLDILYDKLQESKDKQLVIQISQYLMLAVYKVFRRLYDASPKNAVGMFRVGAARWQGNAIHRDVVQPVSPDRIAVEKEQAHAKGDAGHGGEVEQLAPCAVNQCVGGHADHSQCQSQENDRVKIVIDHAVHGKANQGCRR